MLDFPTSQLTTDIALRYFSTLAESRRRHAISFGNTLAQNRFYSDVGGAANETG